jgi:hypothetical protein
VRWTGGESIGSQFGTVGRRCDGIHIHVGRVLPSWSVRRWPCPTSSAAA